MLLAFSPALMLQQLYEKLFYLEKYEKPGIDLSQLSEMDIHEGAHMFGRYKKKRAVPLPQLMVIGKYYTGVRCGSQC